MEPHRAGGECIAEIDEDKLDEFYECQRRNRVWPAAHCGRKRLSQARAGRSVPCRGGEAARLDREASGATTSCHRHQLSGEQRSAQRHQVLPETFGFVRGPNNFGAKMSMRLSMEDRGFVVADLRGQRRIFESDVEIARVLQHQPEKGLVARLDIRRRDAGIGGSK